jgi:hypothetical protein
MEQLLNATDNKANGWQRFFRCFFLKLQRYQLLIVAVLDPFVAGDTVCGNAEQPCDITICPVCHNLMKDPKTLPCMDTFCLKCLEDIERSGEWASDSLCPLCHIPFIIPTAGLESLPSCVFLMRKIHRQVIESQGDGNTICDVCLQADSEAADVPNAVVFASPVSRSCVTVVGNIMERLQQPSVIP